MHFSIVLGYVPIHSWKHFSWMPPHLRRYGSLYSLHDLKTDYLFELGEKKNVSSSKIREIGSLFFSDWNCGMVRALGAGALSWWRSHNLACHKFRLFLPTERTKRNGISYLLFDHLSLWQELPVFDALSSHNTSGSVTFHRVLVYSLSIAERGRGSGGLGGLAGGGLELVSVPVHVYFRMALKSDVPT